MLNETSNQMVHLFVRQLLFMVFHPIKFGDRTIQDLFVQQTGLHGITVLAMKTL